MQTAVQTLVDGWKRPNAPTIPDSLKKHTDDLRARIKKAAIPTFASEPSNELRLLGFAGRSA